MPKHGRYLQGSRPAAALPVRPRNLLMRTACGSRSVPLFPPSSSATASPLSAMHVTSTFAMAALAAASSVSARAIIYRPDLEVRSPAPTGAVDKRATSSSASSSSKVSAVTTLPITTTSATSSAGIWSTSSPAPFSYGKADNSYWGVKGRGKNGPTNPDEPSLNTAINQTSVARLASLNSVDDWCTFGPEPLNNTDTMGDLEATTVAYCTKPRNNARVIVRIASFYPHLLYQDLLLTSFHRFSPTA